MILRAPIHPSTVRRLNAAAAHASRLGVDFTWHYSMPDQVVLEGAELQLSVCVRDLAEGGLLVRPAGSAAWLPGTRGEA